MNSYKSLKNKNVLVTGGTRGIGFSISKLFLKYGSNVYATGTKKTSSLKSGIKYIQCDFKDSEQFEFFLLEIQDLKIDILINNAGINIINKFVEILPSDFLNIHKVNTYAPFRVSQVVIKNMKENKWGRIINIASVFGVVSKEYRASYSSSKFALDGLTSSMAAEVAKSGILVNTVSPGFIETKLTKEILGEKGINEVISMVPIKRLGKPKEVARFVVWLSSEENTFISGQNLIIDGGFTRV